MIIHIVRTNQTLSKLAQQYSVTPESIIEANALQNPIQFAIGEAIVIPKETLFKRNKPEIDVNAYIYTEGAAGVLCVSAAGDSLTYVTPSAYVVREDGSLQPLDDKPIISAVYAQKIVPMMSIVNFTPASPGSDLIHAILSDTAIINKLLNNIVSVMTVKRYLALNIDFENVLPADRELYNSFIMRAADRMHSFGYAISSALPPKYGADQAGMLYAAYDYPVHGKILDFVVLMTYEWGYREGPPQAISPINQIKRVLDYAVTVIPREKILMGFLLYARDWLLPFIPGQVAETFSIAEARLRAVKYNATIQYDITAQSPFYLYIDEQGREHEVWFEDARSAQAKFDTVKEYDLKGISYWALCFPFPQNWVLLNDNFVVQKLLL